MKRYDLDKAFPQTPIDFTRRIDQTLRTIKEEPPVKKFTIRTVLIAAVITIALSGIAYAVINFGQEWYYNTRFTAYQQHQPDKHQAIMQNMQTDIPQESSGTAAGLVTIDVQDASWAEEKQIFTYSLTAGVKDSSKYELYALTDMDADGSFDPILVPGDTESRNVHWLWTDKGHGLPGDMMKDPNKHLMLIDLMVEVYIGDTMAALPRFSTDIFTAEEGPVMGVFELDLKLMDAAEVEKKFMNNEVPQGVDKAQFNNFNQQAMERLMLQADAIKKAIEENTNEDGYLSLRLPYSVTPFGDNVYGEAVQGILSFKVKIK